MKVHFVSNEYLASMKVYVVDNEYLADMKVYPESNEYLADVKVYRVDNEYLADMKVYLVDNPYLVGSVGYAGFSGSGGGGGYAPVRVPRKPMKRTTKLALASVPVALAAAGAAKAFPEFLVLPHRRGALEFVRPSGDVSRLWQLAGAVGLSVLLAALGAIFLSGKRRWMLPVGLLVLGLAVGAERATASLQSDEPAPGCDQLAHRTTYCTAAAGAEVEVAQYDSSTGDVTRFTAPTEALGSPLPPARDGAPPYVVAAFEGTSGSLRHAIAGSKGIVVRDPSGGYTVAYRFVDAPVTVGSATGTNPTFRFSIDCGAGSETVVVTAEGGVRSSTGTCGRPAA